MKKGKPHLLAFIFALLNGIAFLAYEYFVHDAVTNVGMTASIIDMVVVFFGMWWFYSHAKKNNN